MKLDATVFRYITKDEFRVLVAVEMGMRNHEVVPTNLIESIAKVNRGGTYKILQVLQRHKLVAHDGKKYDGYRLTYGGFDFLALRTLVARGTIVGVGRRIGVGKESDVHIAEGPNGEVYALKVHRLGRISFRAIKQKRDYLRHRAHASWQYMARLAAVKEFAYMKALKDEGFPVPSPLDQNRHMIVMTFIDAVPMFRLREFVKPDTLLERLFRLLVRLARAGIVHGDFNEFNLMISADEKVTLIDFPQIISLNHTNAREQFDRDVLSICDFFRRRVGIEVEKWPVFDEVLAEVAADGQGALANLTVEGLSKEDDALLVSAHENGGKESERLGKDEDSEADEEDEEEADGEAEEEEADVDKDAGNNPNEGFDGLVPADGCQALGAIAEQEAELAEAAEAAIREGVGDGEGLGGGGYNVSSEGVAEGAASDNSESESDASDGPGQVIVKTGVKKVRRRQTAKEARTNLQRQRKEKPAKPNNQKVTQARKAKHEIKEYLC